MTKRPLIPVFILFASGIVGTHLFLPHHYYTLYIAAFFILFSLSLFFLGPNKIKFLAMALSFLFTGSLTDFLNHKESNLLFFANIDEKVTIEGTVLEYPRFDNNIARYKVRADLVLTDNENRAVNEKLQLSIYNNPELFAPEIFDPGTRIRFPARLTSFSNFKNPGGYDYSEAMKLEGYFCRSSVSDGRRIVPMGKGNLGIANNLLAKTRASVRSFLEANLDGRNLIFMKALIIGEKQQLTPDLREPFNITGMGHLLAVSGLHIGLVAGLAFAILVKLLSFSYLFTLRVDIRKVAALSAIIPVLAYTALTGFQVSGQRAMIMAVAFLLSIVLEREKEAWSTLGFAGLIILSIDPHAIFSISFQLSFSAVAGILWFGPGLYKIIKEQILKRIGPGTIFYRLCNYFTGLLVVTLSATIILMPITIYYFHRISLVSIPANLAAVPLLGIWVIPFGLLAAFISPVFPSIANLLISFSSFGLDCILNIINYFAALPWASYWIITPNLFELLLIYSLMLFIANINKGLFFKLGVAFLLFTLVLDISYWISKTQFNKGLKITCLDVGQGNSALVQFPGNKRMLIDGGGFSRSSFDIGKMVIAPFLLHSKIRRIDYLVLTHAQSDHMNGLRFIADQFHASEFWHNGVPVNTPSYDSLMKIILRENIDKLSPIDFKNGKDISGVNVDILHPLPEKTDCKNISKIGLNNLSLTMKLSYSGKAALFPGDIEKPAEKLIVANSPDLLKSDILLAPHHGSKYSSSENFVQKVKPKFCVFSSGTNNYFGFPNRETVNRYRKIGSRILRTDQQGAIELTLHQESIVVNTFLKK